ncbi:hypothetical protein CIRG_01189 [Coccidioides immitis RMSCC 2394]|uniref:Uncharacterized protein n=1 Tax=Coccidioides immitis RMSCC 2394 TaxID=404692 RepID=A0A0J6Y251_COCIT|nr:hypothetical protein CIRG_01189 [Coccidioides immitis RMSCC 2394]
MALIHKLKPSWNVRSKLHAMPARIALNVQPAVIDRPSHGSSREGANLDMLCSSSPD